MSETKLINDYKVDNAIIGAGLSGLMMAMKMNENGMDYTIFEKGTNYGGVWNIENNLMNSYTRIQCVSSAFKLDLSDDNYTNYTDSGELYNKIKDFVKNNNIQDKIKYGYELKSFKWNKDDSKVNLVFDSPDGVININSKSLHIRTGNINKTREFKINGEDTFTGEVYYGSNSKSNINYDGKTVMVVGMGASAIENACQAIKLGAKKVILMTRTNRPIWSKYTMFKILKNVLNPLNYLSNTCRLNSWKKVNKTHKKIIDSHKDSVFSSKFIKLNFDETTIDNSFGAEFEFDYKMRGPPQSSAPDEYYIYSYYGLITNVLDEIDVINESEIKTKNNDMYTADIIIKCFGFEMNVDIFKGHDITDTIYVDGTPFISHNCGIDQVTKNTYFMAGPHVSINLLPLVSYTLVNEIFDNYTLHFCKNINRFKKFINYNHFHNGPDVTLIESINVNHYFAVFWKMICYTKYNLISNIFLNFKLATIFLRLIFTTQSEDDFIKENKGNWDKISSFAYEKVKETGNINYYEYPFLKECCC